MGDKGKINNVVPISKDPSIDLSDSLEYDPDPEVVESLELMLEAAKCGKVLEFVGVIRFCDGSAESVREGVADFPDTVAGRLYSTLNYYSYTNGEDEEDEEDY